MQITDIKTYITMPIENLPWLFVEVHTDEGITGLGECSWYGNNTLIQQGIESVKPWVIGQDPANIEEIWQLIYRRHLRIGGRGPISAVISGIDIALWDIKGKALGCLFTSCWEGRSATMCRCTPTSMMPDRPRQSKKTWLWPARPKRTDIEQ